MSSLSRMKIVNAFVETTGIFISTSVQFVDVELKHIRGLWIVKARLLYAVNIFQAGFYLFCVCDLCCDCDYIILDSVGKAGVSYGYCEYPQNTHCAENFQPEFANSTDLQVCDTPEVDINVTTMFDLKQN
jgi:hypothetical protein